MKKVFLNDEEINSDRISEILNNMFYEINTLSYSENLSDEKRNLLLDCLDGEPNGITGVELLIACLNGDAYDIITMPDGKRNFIKKEPMDSKIIYSKINELIDYINTIVSEK